MLRILRVHCPIVRITPGSSFGPITISATTPMSTNSVHEMSNMETLRPSHPSAAISADRERVVRRCVARSRGASGQRALDLAFGLARARRLLMVDGPDRRVGLGSRLGLVLGQALLEGLYALGDVPHHVGNLAAPAEHQKNDGADDEPMPDAQRAHEILRARRRPRPR